MYADDTVLFTHARTKELAASKLSSAIAKVSNWSNNVSKTVCMYFTVRKHPDIVFNGQANKSVTC